MTLSVVVPGKNNPAAWWCRCVDSLLRAGADEIICVDDGSEKGLECPYCYDDNVRVRILRSKDGRGTSAARNAGIELATCDYITFADSDDEVLPETYSCCKSAISLRATDVVVYGVRVIWPNEGLQKTDTFEKLEFFDQMEPPQVRILHEKNLFNYPWNKIYRREFLEKHNLRFNPDVLPSEDFVFNVECLRSCPSCCFVPYAGYVYYRRQGTQVARYNSNLSHSIRLQSAVAKEYKALHHGAGVLLKGWGELTNSDFEYEEWRNVWLPGSPYSLKARWKMKPGLPFVRMLVFMFVRKYMYPRSLRRFNLRRTFPNVCEWHEK